STGDGVRADNGKETQHATEQVARSKLRVDTRMRMAGKLAPKKYGDELRIDQIVRAAPSIPTREDIERRKVAWGKTPEVAPNTLN
ncbi:MAG: hypothetical protein ACREQ5_13000, partial [Candidatus Dormibacteria bacterium]